MLKLGYPWLSLQSELRYPYLSLLILILSNTELNHRWISQHIPWQESYPCISQNNNFSVLGYTGISHKPGYPGTYLYESGYGVPVNTFSLRQSPSIVTKSFQWGGGGNANSCVVILNRHNSGQWASCRAKSKLHWNKLHWNRPKSCSASKCLLWALILDLSQRQAISHFPWGVTWKGDFWHFEEADNLIQVDTG